MTNEKKRYKVPIFGENYILVSSECEEHIYESAQLVTHVMQEIASKSNAVEQHKIAVLAALRIAGELVQARSTMCSQIQRHEALIASIDELFSVVLSS